MQNLELLINDLNGRPVLRLHKITFTITSILDAPRELLGRVTYHNTEWETTTVVMLPIEELMTWLLSLEAFVNLQSPKCTLQVPSKRLSLHLEEEDGIVSAEGFFTSKDFLAEMEFQFETSFKEIKKTIKQAYKVNERLIELEGQTDFSLN